MSVNGGNTNHNLFTLNGSVFTHFNQTTGFNPPPPDAVQEIRIQTHNFSAEYGHTAGSQVSIVSKAGIERLPRHRVGVPPQLGAERPQLLPDAQAGAEAEPGRRERRRRDHPQQAVLVRLVSAAVGSRARRDRARRSCRPMRSAPATSPRSAPQLRNPVNPITERAVHRQHRRPVRGRQHHQPGLHQPGVARAAPAATCPRRRAARSSRCRPRRAITRSTWPAADYHLSGSNQLNAHFFADRSDSSSWPGNVNYVRAGVVQRREPVRHQRLAHLQTRGWSTRPPSPI